MYGKTNLDVNPPNAPHTHHQNTQQKHKNQRTKKLTNLDSSIHFCVWVGTPTFLFFVVCFGGVVVGLVVFLMEIFHWGCDCYFFIYLFFYFYFFSFTEMYRKSRTDFLAFQTKRCFLFLDFFFFFFC